MLHLQGVLGRSPYRLTYRAIDALLDRHLALKELFPYGLAVSGAGGSAVPALEKEAEYAALHQLLSSEWVFPAQVSGSPQSPIVIDHDDGTPF